MCRLLGKSRTPVRQRQKVVPSWIRGLSQHSTLALLALLALSGALKIRQLYGELVREDSLDHLIAGSVLCALGDVGTAAEVSAINSVDDRSVPCPGPITLQVADIYGKAVRGQLPQYKNWCELA